jgi:hypothetical protein
MARQINFLDDDDELDLGGAYLFDIVLFAVFVLHHM